MAGMSKTPATVSIRLMALSSAGVVAACGGGGSTVAVQNSMAIAGAPTSNLQAANATVTYPAASVSEIVSNSTAGGLTTAASGQGATLTLTNDASGNLSKIVFNIPTAGLTFTQTYTGQSSFLDRADLGNFAIALSQVGIIPGCLVCNPDGYALTQAAGTQQLTSSAYGVWASGNSVTIDRGGAFAIGNLTPAASVPTSGTATFNGSTMGMGGSAGGGLVTAFKGNAQMIANFSSQSVTTNLTNLNTENEFEEAGVRSTIPDLTGTSTIAGNAYVGPIAGTGLTGTINGNFYGAGAKETAGVWQASGGGNSWMGSFGAK